MRIDIITLFPGMLTGFLSESMIGRAQESGQVEIGIHNLRHFGVGKWQVTDDRPFGGGAGMLLKPEPLCAAIDSVRKEGSLTIYLSPDGEPFSHDLAVEFSKLEH
ncbi:MAG TPA: tRNA (guanosine(37)-N1)-methyltransferase TrmD, partial [Oceanipulchritudo sp.]|nr:tRNA (guanosine(37)-N1)-methyltransferase TrmD [Oceanipulchritudo sp.]